MIKCAKCGCDNVVGFVRTKVALSGGFNICEFRCKNCLE
jgi:hypothetical protein